MLSSRHTPSPLRSPQSPSCNLCFHSQLIKDLLGPVDTIHQITETTITICRSSGELETVMSEPVHGLTCNTISTTTPIFSTLDCPHFGYARRIGQVQTSGDACTTCDNLLPTPYTATSVYPVTTQRELDFGTKQDLSWKRQLTSRLRTYALRPTRHHPGWRWRRTT